MTSGEKAILVSVVVTPALWWVAVVVCEVMAARAKSDGVDDWADQFWPTMLKRLDRNRYERCKLDVVERKGE
jgi:hypothetical protein